MMTVMYMPLFNNIKLMRLRETRDENNLKNIVLLLFFKSVFIGNVLKSRPNEK